MPLTRSDIDGSSRNGCLDTSSCSSLAAVTPPIRLSLVICSSPSSDLINLSIHLSAVSAINASPTQPQNPPTPASSRPQLSTLRPPSLGDARYVYGSVRIGSIVRPCVVRELRAYQILGARRHPSIAIPSWSHGALCGFRRRGR